MVRLLSPTSRVRGGAQGRPAVEPESQFCLWRVDGPPSQDCPLPFGGVARPLWAFVLSSGKWYVVF